MNWPERSLLAGIGRGAGGALIFAIPMLMTMEMWSLGHAAEPLRLAILLVATPFLLVGLARYVGFRESSRLIDHIADSLVAIAIAALMATVFLGLFGLLEADLAADEVIGMIAIQVVPASIGAMLSRSQLGDQPEGVERRRKTHPSYAGELFLMFVGSLFLSLSVAPTDEVPRIVHMSTPWHCIALIGASLVIMHGFVYFLELRGRVPVERDATFVSVFFRFTLVGYAIVLLTSLALLWVFGRIDGADPAELIGAIVVLSLPGAIGAAAARLLL